MRVFQKEQALGDKLAGICMKLLRCDIVLFHCRSKCKCCAFFTRSLVWVTGWQACHEAAQIRNHAVSLQDNMLRVFQQEPGPTLAGLQLLMCLVMLCHCRRRCCAYFTRSRGWATSWQAGATGVKSGRPAPPFLQGTSPCQSIRLLRKAAWCSHYALR